MKRIKKAVSLFLCIVLFVIFSEPLPVMAEYQGTDIAHYDSTINWQELKNSGHGDFVYIKITEGENTWDNTYQAHVEGAESVDIPYGFYHYFHAYGVDSAIAQADRFYDAIKDYNYALVPAVDLEETDGQDAPEIQADLRAFIDEFYSLSGINPVIYTYYDFAKNFIGDEFTDCTLWLAHYNTDNAGSVPGWGTNYAIWQYSGDTDYIDGIDNKADFDVAYNDDIFIGSDNQAEPVTYGDKDVYSCEKSEVGVPENATTKAGFKVYNSDGTPTAHYINAGERIRIANSTEDNSLLEVFYNIDGTDLLMHGYIPVDMVHISIDGADEWQNNDDYQPTYHPYSNDRVGTLFPSDTADFFYRTGDGASIVGYQTSTCYKVAVVAYSGGIE